MNCCGHSSEQDKVNKDITKKLKEEREAFENEVRLLLLGAGESGKSTIAKQMKIIHMGGFSKEEKESFINAIHANIYDSMQNMIRACENLEIPIKKEENKAFAKKFEDPFSGLIPLDWADRIVALWKDEGIQTVYERRNEYQLNDSAKYYFDDIKRVLAEGYSPTEQDVLRSRIQTTGIIETAFTVEGRKFIIVDVGGQRSERKKWMHCFENVTGVLFCVGISAFDQVLYEDNKTNRMHEALKLFHEICQSKWFSSTAMILFLNKEDLFKEKLKSGKSIKTAFPEYSGSDDYEPSLAYIQEKFTTVTDPVTGKNKDIYAHATCATDTTTVKVVFEAVKDHVLNAALGASNLV